MRDPIANFAPSEYPYGDITQFFGENPALYNNCCAMSGHNGLDIVRSHGTPIFCVETGKVVEVKDNPGGYGRHIRILSNNNEWVYGHLSRIDVVLGQRIEEGFQIGLMGNTGFVVSGATPYWKYNPYAGTHLHLGRKRTKLFVPGFDQRWDLSYPTGDRAIILDDYNNGFFGATDWLKEFYPAPKKPKYKFNNNLSYGMMNNPEVVELQNIMKYEGLLSTNIVSTGNYLEETRKAVLAYQKKYRLINIYQELVSRGKYCYEVTRKDLNNRYA